MKIVRAIYLFVLLAILILPALQMKFGLVKERELKGAYVDPKKPEFSLDSLYKGVYQAGFEKYLETQIGFYKTSVRLRNQLDALFYIYHVQELMRGRKGHFFNRYFAKNYLGVIYNQQHADSCLNQMKEFNGWMASKGIPVLYVITPSKSSYMPENLPSYYLKHKSEKTYFNYYREKFLVNGFNFINAQDWFLKMKDTVKMPLFNETGVHYTTYGASILKDSLMKMISHLVKKPLRTFKVVGYEESDTARWDDNDIEKAMNLLVNPYQRKLYYPVYQFVDSTKDYFQPKVTFVTDSYFYPIETGYWHYNHVLSEDSWHWYYFANAFNFRGRPAKGMEEIDVMKEVNTSNLIVFFGTIGTLEKFPFKLPKYYNEKAAAQK